MIPERVLFVDDDPNILAALGRQLRGKFNLFAATSPEDGLRLLRDEGPFAIIVSDMRMPGMNGVEFFRQAQRIAPHAVRMMLTGNANPETSVRAVNEANIFRLLMKPCALPELIQALADALNQYRLLNAERDVLEQTLSGSVKLLTEMLELSNPHAGGRGALLAGLVRELKSTLSLESSWDIEVAAMLCEIGAVTLPPEILEKAYRHQTLSEAEQKLIAALPEVGSRLLSNIPRLQGVAEIVRFHNTSFDYALSNGLPLSLGARVIKILKAFVEHPEYHTRREVALQALEDDRGSFDPDILMLITTHLATSGDARYEVVVQEQAVSTLELGAGLLSNIETKDGMLVVARGRTLTTALIERIRNFDAVHGVQQPIRVAVKRRVQPTAKAANNST